METVLEIFSRHYFQLVCYDQFHVSNNFKMSITEVFFDFRC